MADFDSSYAYAVFFAIYFGIPAGVRGARSGLGGVPPPPRVSLPCQCARGGWATARVPCGVAAPAHGPRELMRAGGALRRPRRMLRGTEHLLLAFLGVAVTRDIIGVSDRPPRARVRSCLFSTASSGSA